MRYNSPLPCNHKCMKLLFSANCKHTHKVPNLFSQMMNKSKTNDMLTLKTRWQEKSQYHTWFHYNHPDWLDKPSHNTNTLLVSNNNIGKVSTYHFLEPMRKPTKTKPIMWSGHFWQPFDNHSNR